MLRVAKRSDGAAIASIYLACVGDASQAENGESLSTSMAHEIGRIGSTYPFLVWEDESGIQGYAFASRYREGPEFRWSVEEFLFAHQDIKGRMVGKGLLTALVEILRELGYSKVFAAIAAPNAVDEALHRNLEFEPLCTVRDAVFARGAWRDLSWMARTLREPVRSDKGALPLDPIAFPRFEQADSGLLKSILASAAQDKKQKNPLGTEPG
jgi:phosphinothricin acetyltransferase